MPNEVKLDVELRKEFGKGASRRVRRDKKIPAVLYGHGSDPVHLTLPGHETMLALRNSNALLTLALGDSQEHLALPKQIQRHPVTNDIQHVDLVVVKRGERVVVEIPIIVVDEDKMSDVTLVVNNERTELTVSAEATNIPREVEVSVAGFDLDSQVTAGDVKLPEGVELAEDPETLVISISIPDEEPAEPETAEEEETEAEEESEEEEK